MNKIDLYIPGIKKINILNNLSESEIKELLEFASFHDYSEGDVIFREKDYGTSIYMVISGNVKIYKNTENGQDYEIARFNETEFFGEMSFLDNIPRSANAMAAANTLLISLDEERFKRFSHRYSYAAFRFLKNISLESQKRIRQTNEKLLASYEALLKAHNELAENRNFLYNVIRSSSEIIIILDASEKIIIFNSGAERNLNVKSSVVIGQSAAAFFYGDKYKRIFASLYSEGNIYNQDIFLRASDGKKLLTNFSAFLLKSREQKIQGIVIIASNVTEKKLLERQLMQNEKMIFLGKITSQIVHDIKNPLTIINLAKDCIALKYIGSQGPEFAATLKQIADSADRIQKIILNTLNFAKALPDKHEKINICEIIEKSVELAKINIKNRKIQINFDHMTQPVFINANADQMEQVFVNMISNAIHAIAEDRSGLITIRIFGKDRMINCLIQDNGVGMPEDVLQNIFESFFTTRSDKEGSGLGLSICQAIIAQHNGVITCQSKPNEGTIFTINLPAMD